MFDRQQFLADLATFVGFKTVVCQNPDEFRRANSWIRGFFDPVLMSSPPMGSAHAVGEYLDSSSLDAYYQLCYETARMGVD